jgi:HSP20 family molecular chaperone IbpA
MSALTRGGSRSLIPDLIDWLEPPYALLHPFHNQAMRIEVGIEDGRYVVRAEMPGIDPEKQAEVSVLNGILTIHAERPEQAHSSWHSEFRYGSFTRHIALPENANEADIEAFYDKGILEASVGLKRESETGHAGRTIPVRLLQHIEPT